MACNATNSSAIDDDGNLWVWGSGRYGLCGGADPHGGNKYMTIKTDELMTKKKDGPDPSLLKPVKLALMQYDSLKDIEPEHKCMADGEELNAFNLLDPLVSSGNQVFCAQHVSIGSYHGGVVCHDITTNYDFTPLPNAQQEVLKEFKNFL